MCDVPDQTESDSDSIIDRLPHWLPRLSVIGALDAGRLICASEAGVCRSVSALRASVGVGGIHP